MTKNHLDFSQALGESFCEAICPPVPFEDASPHDCYEAVRSSLGATPSPLGLASLTDADVAMVAQKLGTYFESEAPTTNQVREAIRKTLVRWPAE